MRKVKLPVCSQKGSAMLMALMVFLIISIMGTAIITVAAMESKIALNDARTEQARQAADAGIQTARDIIMNNLVSDPSGNTVPDELAVNIKENITAMININKAELDAGIVTITSTGNVSNDDGTKILTSKTAEAELQVNALPNYAIRTNRLKVMGKYFATVSNKSAILEGTFLTELINTQNWDTRDFDTVGIESYPLHGSSYTDFFDPEHRYYEPGNSRNLNPVNQFTWWVEYKYIDIIGTEICHNLLDSTLNVAPIWKPYGLLNVIEENAADDAPPAEIAISDEWDNDPSEFTGIFDDKLTNPRPVLDYPLCTLNAELLGKKEIHWPLQHLKSTDFMSPFTRADTQQKISLEEEQISIYKEISNNHSDWQYIALDSDLLRPTGDSNHYKLIVDDPRLEKTKFFIDLDDTDTVIIDFTTVLHYTDPIFNWAALDDIINNILNQTGTFFNRFHNKLDSLIIVSPASLEVGIDSFMFEGVNDSADVKPHIFLLSGENINLLIDPSMFNNISRIWANADAQREIRLFLMAGKNANIVSTPQTMTFRGILCAGGDMTFLMDYFDEHEEGIFPIREIEKKINIIKDSDIINQFPESWAYIGMGTITSYKYID